LSLKLEFFLLIRSSSICSVAEFETFTQKSLGIFVSSRNPLDRKTLISILKQLQLLRERQQYSDQMFEPLLQSAKLLADYGLEVPEENLKLLQVSWQFPINPYVLQKERKILEIFIFVDFTPILDGHEKRGSQDKNRNQHNSRQGSGYTEENRRPI
jgi:hypothetical protein